MPGSDVFVSRRRIRRISTAGLLVLGLVSAGTRHVHHALADGPGTAVFEASQDFCLNPAVPCSDSAHFYNMGYEEVAAVNFSGSVFGPPDAAVLVCAKPYISSDGHLHNLAGHAFPGYDGGSITGYMRFGRNATESSTSTPGSINISVVDPVVGTTGTAQGTQVTNNVTDVPLSSNITVTISGSLENDDFTTQTTTRVNGTISCNIRLPYVTGPAPFGQPPDSEIVLSDTDGD